MWTESWRPLGFEARGWAGGGKLLAWGYPSLKSQRHGPPSLLLKRFQTQTWARFRFVRKENRADPIIPQWKFPKPVSSCALEHRNNQTVWVRNGDKEPLPTGTPALRPRVPRRAELRATFMPKELRSGLRIAAGADFTNKLFCLEESGLLPQSRHLRAPVSGKEPSHVDREVPTTHGTDLGQSLCP